MILDRLSEVGKILLDLMNTVNLEMPPVQSLLACLIVEQKFLDRQFKQLVENVDVSFPEVSTIVSQYYVYPGKVAVIHLAHRRAREIVCKGRSAGKIDKI
jgi:hypothetical protein